MSSSANNLGDVRTMPHRCGGISQSSEKRATETTSPRKRSHPVPDPVTWTLSPPYFPYPYPSPAPLPTAHRPSEVLGRCANRKWLGFSYRIEPFLGAFASSTAERGHLIYIATTCQTRPKNYRATGTGRDVPHATFTGVAARVSSRRL